MKLVGILYFLILIFDLIIVCGMGEEFTLFLTNIATCEINQIFYIKYFYIIGERKKVHV